MRKEIYATPEMETLKIEEDVVTTSGGGLEKVNPDTPLDEETFGNLFG